MEDPFKNGMYWLVVNRGLDTTVNDSWEWFRKLRLEGQPSDVAREHVVEVSRQCDEIVRGLFPDQFPFYSKMMNEKISLLEGSPGEICSAVGKTEVTSSYEKIK